MAFANLFTALSAVEEDVKRPGHPDSTHRNKPELGDRGDARKRRIQGDQTGPYRKKQHYQTGTYNDTSDDPMPIHYHMHNTGGQHRSDGFTKDVERSHGDEADHNDSFHKGQNYKATNNRHGNMWQKKKKKTEGQKYQHQQNNRGKPAFRGGGHQNYQARLTQRRVGEDRKNKNDKKDFQVRFMSQEFIDQNVLLVDGRFLCRHFLWGRCIKEDSCQLEHVQGYNDLVKEICKYYVQGFCIKGESCPYMHKSFPCKFFHRKGKCSKGADCKFSHEPLNEATSELLDEAIKRETVLYELPKKAEQEASGQPASTDESETVEANKTADIFIQPLRPNFYQCVDTNAEQEASSCQTEEADQPHSQEPVCYSVEAVLGSQLSKPYTSFFTAPRSQESAPLSSSDCTSGSANQSQVPYSVDAVLRSCKLAENSPSRHTVTAPAAQTVSYTPKTDFNATPDPPLSPETQNKKVLCSVNTGHEAPKSQEKLFKSLPSLQAHSGLISKTCADHTLTPEGHSKQGGTLLQPTVITSPANCKSEGVLPLAAHKRTFSWATSQTLTSTPPSQTKPHLPVQTSVSRTLCTPFAPPKGLTAIKGGAVTSPVKSRKIHLHPKKTRSGLELGTKHRFPTETTAECRSKTAHCGDLADACKETPKRPFRSLFASPIAETLQPVSPICPQGSVQSSCPAPQATDRRNDDLKSAPEPGKASSGSFLGLFASPLAAAPQPDNSRTSSYSQQSLQSANLKMPLPRRVRTDVKENSHAPSSPDFSPNANVEKNTIDVSQPTKQPESLVCSLVSDSLSQAPCGDGPSTSLARQRLPDISPPKASADSVLKSLFLCLSPYQQDGEPQGSVQISLPSEHEKKDKNSTGCVSVRRQWKSKKCSSPLRKWLHTRESSSPVPRLLKSPQRTGGSTLCSPGVTAPQARKPGTHSLPVVSLMQHHTQPRVRPPSEGERCVKGNKTATPFKDLFKT